MALKFINVTKLSNILPLLVEEEKTFMFDLQLINISHPYYHMQMEIVESVFKNANFPPQKV